MTSAIQQSQSLFTGSFGTTAPSPKKSDYVIIDPRKHRLVGEGAAGKVYAAQNPITNSPWAVKVYHKDFPQDRASREYEILSTTLNEAPHTVRAKKLISSSTKTEFVMERLKSSDLYAMISRNPNICTLSMFSNIAQQGLKALHYYQNKKIVHSDIKLDNCFYNLVTNRLTICDLGLAFYPEKEQFIDGTLPYAAPEILLKQPISYEIDMWAFGVMLFTLYTGNYMFFGHTKEIKHNEEILYLYGLQFGAPFYKYIGTLFLSHNHKLTISEVEEGWNESTLIEVGQSSLARYAIEIPNKWYMLPWRERIHRAAESKREKNDAESIISFLEKIFVPPEIRMTPEEGLQWFFPNYLDHISPNLLSTSNSISESKKDPELPKPQCSRIQKSQVISHPLERSALSLLSMKWYKTSGSGKIQNFCKITSRPKKDSSSLISQKEKENSPNNGKVILGFLRDMNQKNIENKE